MKLVRWIMTILTRVLSISSLTIAAHAQVPFQNLPKVMDASMSRDQQISIAFSAGPEEVANKATVYVLGPKGYEKAREGMNGAICLVGRHFVKPTETTIEPMCYDPEGSRTLLIVDLYAEELRSRGTSEGRSKRTLPRDTKKAASKRPASRVFSTCCRATIAWARLLKVEPPMFPRILCFMLHI